MTTPSVEGKPTERLAESKFQERLQSLALDRPAEPKPRRRGRWLIAFLVLGTLAAVGYRYFASDSSQRQTLFAYLNKAGIGQSSTDCEVIVVSLPEADDFVLETTGFISAKSKVHLNPSIPGKIVELPIKEGEKIKKGDVVVRIDDVQFKADVLQATAALELAKARLRELQEGSRKEDIAQARSVVAQAQARVNLANAEFKRYEILKDSVSTSEYDKALSARDEAKHYLEQVQQSLSLLEAGARPVQLEVAQAEIDRAAAALSKAKHLLDSAVVCSPIDGTVLQKTGELGEYIRPESLVQSLCVIADLNDVEVEVDVQERDLALVKVGLPCKLTVEAYGDREFHGKVARILPIASRQRGAVQLRIGVADAKGELIPDMNCRVVLSKPASEVKEARNYRVPLMAVAKEGQKAFVFVLRDSAARRVSVELGKSSAGQVEIIDGVKEGDRLLLARNGTLQDGQAVIVPDSTLN
jgi:RND family efflux transporter MFP subunit